MAVVVAAADVVVSSTVVASDVVGAKVGGMVGGRVGGAVACSVASTGTTVCGSVNVKGLVGMNTVLVSRISLSSKLS